MVTIRRARIEDQAALFHLVSAFPTSTPPDEAMFRAQLSAKVSDASSFIAVAEHDGMLLGYVSAYRHIAFYAAGQVAWIDELFVDESFRGRGIGRDLVRECESWASGAECSLIGLATRGAREFYEHHGYQSKAGYYKRYLRSDA